MNPDSPPGFLLPIPLEKLEGKVYERAPEVAGGLRRMLAPFDRLMDRAYGSRWNPFPRSGPVALALLLFVIASGVYLLFLYRIGSPYESVVRIQEQVWGGRWIRALHRYASDLAVVFVGFHALRMLIDGRTWGPRVLAWVSGIMLTAAMLVCGWTGYVMIWDDHGLLLGVAGARLFDALPFLATPLGRTFSGAGPVLSSFFFLNLFLHMAIPLLMALLLWIHTARLARSHWLPDRRVLWGLGIGLTVLSIAWPAALDPPADPLKLGDRATFDVFYTGWVPAALRLPPVITWLGVTAGLAGALLIPAWWRPRADRQPEVSTNNQAACTGCVQCTLDCPFEAIRMVPRRHGPGSAEMAEVNPARCVSCGVCAGSCDQLAIGPPGRTGKEQLRAARAATRTEPADAVAFVGCRRIEADPGLITRLTGRAGRLAVFDVECVGSLHPLALVRLLGHFRAVFVRACAENRCQTREGVALAAARFFGGRDPGPESGLDPSRLRLVSGSAADADAMARAFDEFLGDLEAGRPVRAHGGVAPGGLWRRGLAAGVAAVGLAGVAALSAVRAGSDTDSAVIRLAWRLPGQKVEDCTPLSPEQIAALPQHMRRTEDCRTLFLSYRLRVSIDDRLVLERTVSPLGARGDRPLFVEADLPVRPGQRRLAIDFVPERDPSGEAVKLEFRGDLAAPVGRAALVSLDAAGRQLEVREVEAN